MTRRSSDEVDAAHAMHAGSGAHDGPRCACSHDGTRWRAMCATAQTEVDALHTRAALEYRNTVRSLTNGQQNPGQEQSPWD